MPRKDISKPQKTPVVSVIVVNYNGGEWLAKCVASLAAQTFENFEAFIVDNGSTDGSLATLPKLDVRFTIIETGENLGFAAANNLAAKKAKGDWLALLNPDAFARPDWIECLLAETQRGANVTMVGSTQFMALEADMLDGAGDFYHACGLAWRGGFGHPASSAPNHAIEAFAPCAAGGLYDRRTFLAIGGFDERFFCYHEDVDLGYRMRLAGGICVQSRGAIIDHISSGISGRASDFAVYHGTRNRIWTFAKNTPGLLLPLLFPLHIALNIFMLFWAGIRSGRFRPTARGVWHAVLGLGPIIRSRRDVKKHRAISRRAILRSLTWAVSPVRQRAVPKHARELMQHEGQEGVQGGINPDRNGA
ncbi:MAG: glycosyltransferase family 2 protein [Maricaulaceae bacterium]